MPRRLRAPTVGEFAAHLVTYTDVCSRRSRQIRLAWQQKSYVKVSQNWFRSLPAPAKTAPHYSKKYLCPVPQTTKDPALKHYRTRGFEPSSRFVEGVQIEAACRSHKGAYIKYVTAVTGQRRVARPQHIWWVWVDLNHRPHPYQGCALTN